MKLSKSSAQAALAVGYLADRTDHGPIQARQIGEYLGIPTDSALKILQTLARRQVIQSRLGRGGGYHYDPDGPAVNLLQIIEAIEGPITAQVAVQPADRRQEQAMDALQNIFERTARYLRDQLARHDVRDMRPVDPDADSMPLYPNSLSEVA